MTIIKHKESVEIKMFNEDEKNAELSNHFKHRKPQKNEKDELIATLERIAKEVDEDPDVWKTEEEHYRRYGTLSEEDMRKTFTI